MSEALPSLSTQSTTLLDDHNLEILLAEDTPQDYKKVLLLLRAFGVQECEENVPMMLLEFINRIFFKFHFLCTFFSRYDGRISSEQSEICSV
jgi:hypothetical protein